MSDNAHTVWIIEIAKEQAVFVNRQWVDGGEDILSDIHMIFQRLGEATGVEYEIRTASLYKEDLARLGLTVDNWTWEDIRFFVSRGNLELRRDDGLGGGVAIHRGMF
jgi:hypothetical protein